jgi:hypothetical protein
MHGVVSCQMVRSPFHKVRTMYFPSIRTSESYTLTLEDISDDPPDLPDPADVADADAYEELLRDNSTILHDQMTVGDASGIQEPTERYDQSEVGDHADLTPPQGMSTLVVDQFPFGSAGMPIPDKPQGSSAYESWQAAFTDSPWAPFHSELEWNVARWVKTRGPSSTAATELLAIPVVRVSH